MQTNSLLRTVAATAALLIVSTAASAASYCLPGTSNADGMKLSDVTFTGNTPTPNADDCYGIVAGQDVAPDGQGDKADNINGLSLTWGTDWTYLVKDDVDGGTTAGSFGGITYTLDSGAKDIDGSWSLTAAGALPVFVDFIVSLKGSNDYALWFFDDVEINASNGGVWNSVFKNNNGNLQDLSHLTLFVRAGEDPSDPPVILVPEPSSLALAGLALLAIGAARRRRG